MLTLLAAMSPLLPGGPATLDYISTWPAQSVIALAAIAGARALEQRPRGALSPLLLVARPSTVPGAGRGLYAGVPIAGGSALGTYPGRVLSMPAYLRKLARTPRAAEYCWQLSDGRQVLDPTDATGKLLEPIPLFEPLPRLLPSLAVPTTLALINEPPPGADVNIDTFEQGAELTFVTNRDIREGEELFLDYGQTYDRSSYGRAGS